MKLLNLLQVYFGWELESAGEVKTYERAGSNKSYHHYGQILLFKGKIIQHIYLHLTYLRIIQILLMI